MPLLEKAKPIKVKGNTKSTSRTNLLAVAYEILKDRGVNIDPKNENQYQLVIRT